MANFEVDKIRNVAVIAHGGAGKTSLVEAMLFDSGSIDRIGRVRMTALQRRTVNPRR